MPVPPEKIERAARFLEHEDETLQRKAVQVLAKIGPEATPAILKRLSHPRKEVRVQAIRALDEIGDLRALKPLKILLLLDKEREVRARAAEALADYLDPSTIMPLRQALLKDKEPNVRWQAAWSLGRIRHVRSAISLVRALNDKDAEVRHFVRRSLQKLLETAPAEQSEGAVKPLISLLKHDDESLQKAAAHMLVRMSRHLNKADLQDSHAKALQLFSPHLEDRENPKILKFALEMALGGNIPVGLEGQLLQKLRAEAARREKAQREAEESGPLWE